MASRREIFGDSDRPLWARACLTSVPSLGLKDEKVIVSCCGSRRLLLMSLVRPELGKLVLRVMNRK